MAAQKNGLQACAQQRHQKQTARQTQCGWEVRGLENSPHAQPASGSLDQATCPEQKGTTQTHTTQGAHVAKQTSQWKLQSRPPRVQAVWPLPWPTLPPSQASKAGACGLRL